MSTNIPWWFTKAYKTIKLLLPELSQAKYTGCELLMRCLIPHSLTTHGQQRENSVGHLYTDTQCCPLVYYSKEDNVKNDL